MAQDDLGDLTARLKLDTSDASAAVTRVADSFPMIGAAAIAVTAAVGGVGFAAIDMSTKFDTATDQMAARAGITQAAAKAIGDAFLSTAGQTTFSADTIMNAFAPVAGQLATTEGHALGAGEALDVMRASMDLAEASGSSLSDTTSALANVMQAYRIPVQGAAQASDLLFNTSRSLNIPVSDLADTVDKLHAKLGPLAPSLSDVSSLLMDVESHGLTGNRALLLVSTGMNTLLSNTKPVEDEVKNLGLNLYDAQGNFVGMGSVLDQLSPKLQGMTEDQRLAAEKILFGATASKALDDTLMAGLPAYDRASDAANKLGTAHAGAGTATDNLGGAIDRAKAAIGDYLIKIGEQLQPVLNTLADWFTTKGLPAFQAFADWTGSHVVPALEQLGNFIRDHVIPVVQEMAQWFEQHVVPVLQQLGTFVTATVVPALESLWTVFSTKLLPVIQDVAGWFTDHVAPVLINLAQTVIPPLVAVIGGAASGLVGALTGAYNAASTFVNWAKDHWPELTPVVGALALVLGPLVGQFVAVQAAAVAAAIQSGIAWGAFVAGAMLNNAALVANAVLQSGATSLAWITKAGEAAAAWAVTGAGKFAGIIASFATTVATAIAQAAATAAAWIAQAASAAAAWIGDFVTKMAGAGTAVEVSAGTSSAITAGEWSGAAIGAEGAWSTAYGQMIDGAATVASKIGGVLAVIAVAQQGIKNLINDFKNSPLGQGTGWNPLPPPGDWRNDVPGGLGSWGGGIIPPGQWGIVSETGSEPIFADPVSGAVVVPHGDVAPMGGPVVNNYIELYGSNIVPADLAREIAWAIK